MNFGGRRLGFVARLLNLLRCRDQAGSKCICLSFSPCKMGQVIGGVVERIGCVVCVKHLVQHKVLRDEGGGGGGGGRVGEVGEDGEEEGETVM